MYFYNTDTQYWSFIDGISKDFFVYSNTFEIFFKFCNCGFEFIAICTVIFYGINSNTPSCIVTGLSGFGNTFLSKLQFVNNVFSFQQLIGLHFYNVLVLLHKCNDMHEPNKLDEKCSGTKFELNDLFSSFN